MRGPGLLLASHSAAAICFECFPRAVSSIVFARWNPHIPLPIQFLPCQHVYKIKYFWCPVLAPPWTTFAGSACISFLYSLLFCFMRSSLKMILIVNLSLAVESLLHVDRSVLVSTYPEEEMCRAKHWWQGPAVRTACISVRFSFGLLQVWFPGLNFKQCLGDINQLLRHIFQFNITWEEPRSVLLSPSEMYEGLLGGLASETCPLAGLRDTWMGLAYWRLLFIDSLMAVVVRRWLAVIWWHVLVCLWCKHQLFLGLQMQGLANLSINILRLELALQLQEMGHGTG